jgi:mono/diheme cytochrome c family protein
VIDSLYQWLAAIGFKDPLHAPITHFPIGLAIGALLFFLGALIFSRKSLVLTARHVAILAFLFAFPTILFGVFDWLHFFKGVLLIEIKIKMILAAAVLVILAAGIILGSEIKVRTVALLIVYALASVAVIGLGWFGGRLVYGGWSASTAAAQVAPQAPPSAAQPQAPAPVATAPSKAGEALFVADCQACHPNGGNIIVAQLPLKSAKQLASEQSFVSFIRAPKMPDGSAGSMPAFTTGTISDQQAGELYQYILAMRSRWP